MQKGLTRILTFKFAAFCKQVNSQPTICLSEMNFVFWDYPAVPSSSVVSIPHPNFPTQNKQNYSALKLRNAQNDVFKVLKAKMELAKINFPNKRFRRPTN